MTRLIPTRDRAQATVYETQDAAWAIVDRLRTEGSEGYADFIDDEQSGWVARLYTPQGGAIWSGPWYVREVAE